MKLPEDKKERVKVLILIAIGAVALVYGLWVGVVSPMMKGRKDGAARIGDLDAKIKKARDAVNQMQKSTSLNSNVVSEIVEAANRRNYVLHDRLGNYLLGAQEILEAHARKSGVTLDAVTEIGQSQIPGIAASTNGPAFRCYTSRVALRAGIHDLIKFLAEVETGNPYLCVSSLVIASQPDKPDLHSITLDVQWPIWASADVSALIESRMKDLEENADDTQPPATNSTTQGEAARK